MDVPVGQLKEVLQGCGDKASSGRQNCFIALDFVTRQAMTMKKVYLTSLSLVAASMGVLFVEAGPLDQADPMLVRKQETKKMKRQ